jgi:hypothetical protein
MDEVPRRFYEVWVVGGLDSQWSNWFEDLTVAVPDDDPGVTVLRGVLDQSALRGVLNRLWDLNLTLVAVTSHITADSGKSGGGSDD